MPDSSTEYVIQIPGVSDIIRIPPMDSEEVKRERVARWQLQATQSAIPESLRWLPEVINWLDDAQDILITALILGKPLLRRLPSRFIPYLGWALLANDLINVWTAYLSAPLVPRVRKAGFHKWVAGASAGMEGLTTAGRTFLLPGRIKWVPFLLQAGQALETFTGWGLRLGGIMGAVSDTFWGAIRALGGSRVVIHGPPSHDPLTKAVSFLVRSFYWRAFADVANPQEIGIMVNAINAAASIIGAPNLIPISDQRLADLANTTTPIYDPWNQATRNVLASLGYPTVENQRVPIPAAFDNLNFGDATTVAIASDPGIDIELAARMREHAYDWPYGLQANEFSQWTWDCFASGHDFVVPLKSPMQKMLSFALETGVVPPFLYWPEDPRIIDDELARGIQRLPVGTTTVTQPGFWRLDPRAKFPPVYPPPDEDPNVQLAHWCAIALGLYCGKPVMIPQWASDPTGNPLLIRLDANTRRWGILSPLQAAGLVWGTGYTRLQRPSPDEPPPIAPPGPRPSYCRPSGTAWPSLSGRNPEFSPLLEILTEIQPALHTEQRFQSFPYNWDTPLGRDWLDLYLRQFDPRRATHPTNIPASSAGDPTPWDVTDLNP